MPIFSRNSCSLLTNECRPHLVAYLTPVKPIYLVKLLLCKVKTFDHLGPFAFIEKKKKHFSED